MRKLLTNIFLLIFPTVLFAQSPEEISKLLTDQFLSANPQSYCPVGYNGAKKPAVNEKSCVTYPVVSLWVTALENASFRKDSARLNSLIQKFEPFAAGQKSSNGPTHVDYSIYGALPLEIYIQNQDKRALKIGLEYADTQWNKPGPDAFPDHGMMDLIPDDAVSSVTVATDLTADANGFISTPLYISVMPTPGAAIGLKAYSDKGEEYATLSMISSADIEAANYYYLSKKMGIAVAEIVETGELFASIHSAIERSNASLTPVTVKLRSDITVKDSIIVKNENCLTTIDFNGYTITGNLMGAPVLRVKSDLTLNDSSAGGNGGIVNTYANVNSRAIYVLWNSQLLTINGGTYSSKADTGVIYYRGISSKIVINGGKFINNRATGGSAVYIYGSTSISGVINGGTFICNNGGSGNAVRSANKAKVTINGGYFHNGTSSGQSVGQASTAGITGNVYGGYFNKALPAEYIATGHTGKAVSVEHDGLTYSYMVE